MKVKKTTEKAKTPKIKNIKSIIIELGPKREDKNGFPDPVPAQCFKCQKQF